MNNLCIVSAQAPNLTPTRFVSSLDLVSSDVEKLRADGYAMIVVEPITFGFPTVD